MFEKGKSRILGAMAAGAMTLTCKHGVKSKLVKFQVAKTLTASIFSKRPSKVIVLLPSFQLLPQKSKKRLIGKQFTK